MNPVDNHFDQFVEAEYEEAKQDPDAAMARNPQSVFQNMMGGKTTGGPEKKAKIL